MEATLSWFPPLNKNIIASFYLTILFFLRRENEKHLLILSMLKTVLLLHIFVETFFLDSLMNIKLKQNVFAI